MILKIFLLFLGSNLKSFVCVFNLHKKFSVVRYGQKIFYMNEEKKRYKWPSITNGTMSEYLGCKRNLIIKRYNNNNNRIS